MNELIKLAVEKLFEPYITLYDGPNEDDVAKLARQAVNATWQDAINIVVLIEPPGHDDFRGRLIAKFKSRILPP